MVKIMNLDKYKEIIKNNMGEYRFNHSVNVSHEAGILAEIYGADVDKAKLAGMIHDATKEFSPEYQLQIIGESGIILDNIELVNKNLLHAISGCAYAESVLGITDTDILNAIRYHTTGRANMSILEKVIYMADFTSAERKFEGVGELRQVARQDLDKAIIITTSFTISELAKRRATIHPNVVNLYNQIICKNL